MGKKKSKTQKYKKNVKRKQTKIANNASAPKTKITEKDKVIYNVAVTKPEILEKSKSKTNKKVTSTKKIVKKETTKKELTSNIKKTVNNIKERILSLISKKQTNNKNKKQTKNKNSKQKNIQKEKKITKKDLPKKAKRIQNKKTQTNKTTEKVNNIKIQKRIPKNKFEKVLFTIIDNLHIAFNGVLIIIFIILFIGLKTSDFFKTGTICYISGIFIFLMLIAISYNKFISGKIFSVLISIAMIFGIYYLNYNFDFISSLNSKQYESKTYYVVAIDNNLNKSIYNINNKKVGLLKENNINIERKLNTKLDNITYIEFESLEELYKSFYNQEFRAVILTNNQYKYLVNNNVNNKKVKVLYEFKANSLK